MSYTAKEYFKLHGTLTPDMIEYLLDVEELAQVACDTMPCLDEASCQYPDKETGSDMVQAFRECYGTTTIQGKFWTGRIEDEMKTLSQQAEYGIAELTKVTDALLALDGRLK